MRRMYVAMLAAGLLASGSGLQAQAAPKHEAKAEHKMAGMGKQAGMGKMGAEHAAMMKLQASAIRNAQASAKLAAASKPNQKLVERDATRSRDALQKVSKHLQEAEGSVPADMKADVTKARTHEDEALKHAEELVTTSRAAKLDAAAVKMHADAVVEHARAAEAVMKAHHEAHQAQMGKMGGMGKMKAEPNKK